MSLPTADELVRKKCAPCEGGVPPLTATEVEALLGHVEGWALSHEGTRIRRTWTAKNYQAAIGWKGE